MERAKAPLVDMIDVLRDTWGFAVMLGILTRRLSIDVPWLEVWKNSTMLTHRVLAERHHEYLITELWEGGNTSRADFHALGMAYRMWMATFRRIGGSRG
jgi:hypothetical protein